MNNLNELSASAARKMLTTGETNAEALTKACLDRIMARNGDVGAFAHVDPEFSIREAKKADRETPRSPLHGIPFAVKDVIDTQDFPTERGTPIHRGRQPAADAKCVALMRDAGAVLLGKLVTTEYAMFTPNETRHPHNLEHTAGGSSSGTGAAVADNMVPIAFGNQTAGSLIRPAAFCGVYGLKPTHGITDGTGILPLQLYFDTLGYMARDVEDIQQFFGIVSGESKLQAWPDNVSPKIGVCETFQWDFAEPQSRQALHDTAEQFSNLGAHVEHFKLPQAYADLVAVHRCVLYRGISQSLADDYKNDKSLMSEGLINVIEEGQAYSEQQFAAAFAIAEESRESVNDSFGAFDAIICPSAPGEAPHGRETGSPIFQVSWTLLGVPCLNLPIGVGPNGLPLGVQLIGRRFDDARLLAIGKHLMSDFAPLKIPGP